MSKQEREAEQRETQRRLRQKQQQLQAKRAQALRNAARMRQEQSNLRVKQELIERQNIRLNHAKQRYQDKVQKIKEKQRLIELSNSIKNQQADVRKNKIKQHIAKENAKSDEKNMQFIRSGLRQMSQSPKFREFTQFLTNISQGQRQLEQSGERAMSQKQLESRQSQAKLLLTKSNEFGKEFEQLSQLISRAKEIRIVANQQYNVGRFKYLFKFTSQAINKILNYSDESFQFQNTQFKSPDKNVNIFKLNKLKEFGDGEHLDEILNKIGGSARHGLKLQVQKIKQQINRIRYQPPSRNELAEMLNKSKTIEQKIALLNYGNELTTKGSHTIRLVQAIAILIALNNLTKSNHKNSFLQVNTGEGKTTIISFIAAVIASNGQAVDIMTSNQVLAAQSVDDRRSFFSLFGISVSHNNPDFNHPYITGPLPCYQSHIVYGTIGNFQSDYLKNQVNLLNTKGNSKRASDFGFAIFDQADNILIDNAAHTVKLSQPVPGMKQVGKYYLDIWIVLIQSALELKIHPDPNAGTATRKENAAALTKKMKTQPLNGSNNLPEVFKYYEGRIDILIEAAIKAYLQMHQDKEYIVEPKGAISGNPQNKDSIIPIDQVVGTTMQNTVLTYYNQFLQLKHNLEQAPDSISSIFIANSTYIKLYKRNVIGLTGTVGIDKERQLICEYYQGQVTIIPPYRQKNVVNQRTRIVRDESWANSIFEEIKRKCKSRACIVICKTIADVYIIQETIQNQLTEERIHCFRHEGDAQIIEKINSSNGILLGHVILATNVGGRGTDVKLSQEVRNNGGLHQITAFLPSSKREQIQAQGRAGRSGDPGSTIVFMRRSQLSNMQLQGSIDVANVEERRAQLQKERVQKSKQNMQSIQQLGKVFSENFANYLIFFKFCKINKHIEDDIKFKWGLLIDRTPQQSQKGQSENESEQFWKQLNEIAENIKEIVEGSVQYKFKSPFLAMKYVSQLLEISALNPGNGDDLTTVIGKSILSQPCVQTQTTFIKHLLMFQICITEGAAIQNKFKRIVKHIIGCEEKAQNGYKQKARYHLQTALTNLTQKMQYYERNILAKIGSILIDDGTDGDNVVLSHINSDYTLLAMHKENVEQLIGVMRGLGQSQDVTIELRSDIDLDEQDESMAQMRSRIHDESLQQLKNIGGGVLYKLKILSDVDKDCSKVKQALGYICGGLAALALNLIPIVGPFLSSAASSALLQKGINSILEVIIEEEIPFSWQDFGMDLLTFGLGKLVKCMKTLSVIIKAVRSAKKAGKASKLFQKVLKRSIGAAKAFTSKLKKVKPNMKLKNVLKRQLKQGAKIIVDTQIQHIINEAIQNVDLQGKINQYIKGPLTNMLRPICQSISKIKKSVSEKITEQINSINFHLPFSNSAYRKQHINVSFKDFFSAINNHLTFFQNVSRNLFEQVSKMASKAALAYSYIASFFDGSMKGKIKGILNEFKKSKKKSFTSAFDAVELLTKLINGQIFKTITSSIDQAKSTLLQICNFNILSFIDKVRSILSGYFTQFQALKVTLAKYQPLRNNCLKIINEEFKKYLREQLTQLLENNPVTKFLTRHQIDPENPESLINKLSALFIKPFISFITVFFKKKFATNANMREKDEPHQSQQIEEDKRIQNSYQKDCVHQAVRLLLQLDSIDIVSKASGIYAGENGATEHEAKLLMETIFEKPIARYSCKADFYSKVKQQLKQSKSVGGIALMSGDKIGHAFSIKQSADKSVEFSDKQSNNVKDLKFLKALFLIPTNLHHGQLRQIAHKIKTAKASKVQFITGIMNRIKEQLFGANAQYQQLNYNKNAKYEGEARKDKKIKFNISIQGQVTFSSQYHLKAYYCPYYTFKHVKNQKTGKIDQITSTNFKNLQALCETDIQHYNKPQLFFAFTEQFAGCSWIFAIDEKKQIVRLYHDNRPYIQCIEKMIGMKKNGATKIVRVDHIEGWKNQWLNVPADLNCTSIQYGRDGMSPFAFMMLQFDKKSGHWDLFIQQFESIELQKRDKVKGAWQVVPSLLRPIRNIFSK